MRSNDTSNPSCFAFEQLRYRPREISLSFVSRSRRVKKTTLSFSTRRANEEEGKRRGRITRSTRHGTDRERDYARRDGAAVREEQRTVGRSPDVGSSVDAKKPGTRAIDRPIALQCNRVTRSHKGETVFPQRSNASSSLESFALREAEKWPQLQASPLPFIFTYLSNCFDQHLYLIVSVFCSVSRRKSWRRKVSSIPYIFMPQWFPQRKKRNRKR